MSNGVRRAKPASRQSVETDRLASPQSVLLSKPLTGVAVHAHAGHLLIDLQSSEGNVRMQLIRRDLPVVLTALVNAVGKLAALSE